MSVNSLFLSHSSIQLNTSSVIPDALIFLINLLGALPYQNLFENLNILHRLGIVAQ